ncbi:hypothetical protein ABZ540_15830 [Nocardia xishanensis]|uniref:hypothetical protein n=1 Tax=Nocardia xishanensis TaxID=238964 RepID=UPI0033DD491C
MVNAIKGPIDLPHLRFQSNEGSDMCDIDTDVFPPPSVVVSVVDPMAAAAAE